MNHGTNAAAQHHLAAKDPRERLRRAVHGVFLRVDGVNSIHPPTIPAPGQSRLSVDFHRSFVEGYGTPPNRRPLPAPLVVDGVEWVVIPQGDGGVQFRHCQNCRDHGLICAHPGPCNQCTLSGSFCSVINLFFDGPTVEFFYTNRWIAEGTVQNQGPQDHLDVLQYDVFGVRLQENGIPAADWELMPTSTQTTTSLAFHVSFDWFFPIGGTFRASDGLTWAVVNRRERGVQFRYCSSRDPKQVPINEAAPCAGCVMSNRFCAVVEFMFDNESDPLFAELVAHHLPPLLPVDPNWPNTAPIIAQQPQQPPALPAAPATTAANPPTAAGGQPAAAAQTVALQPPRRGPPRVLQPPIRARYITVQGAPPATANPVACFLTAMEILAYFPEWLIFDQCLIRFVNSGWAGTEMARAIGFARGWDAARCSRYRSTLAHRIPKAGKRIYQNPAWSVGTHTLAPRAVDFDPLTWTVATDWIANNMTDYRLMDVLNGVQNVPTGPDAGEFSRYLAYQQANPGQVLWLSDIPQLLQANPAWRTNRAALGPNPDRAALNRWMANPGRITVT